jgi:anti-sigma-K factor RskA
MTDPRDDDLDLDAAEYVLAIGPARGEAEARLASDPAFAAAVEAWTRRLYPLADEIAPVACPDVWARVVVATTAQVHTLAPRAANDNRMGFWRTWAVSASGVAALALVGLMMVSMRPAAPPPHQMLATLRTHDGAADVVVAFNTGSRDLILTPIGGMPPPGKTPQLWMRMKDGGMKRFGTVDMAHPHRAHLSPEMAHAAEGAVDVMVSLENTGEQMTRPTGPIVARGAFALV